MVMRGQQDGEKLVLILNVYTTKGEMVKWLMQREDDRVGELVIAKHLMFSEWPSKPKGRGITKIR